MIVSGSIRLKRVGRNSWMSIEDVRYHTFAGEITVTAGFVCNLLSVPEWVAKLLKLNPNKEERVVEAALLHDYLYHYNYPSRREADLMMLEVMEHYNSPEKAWQRVSIFMGLRLFGWFTYWLKHI
jgi:hypothetical protein